MYRILLIILFLGAVAYGQELQNTTTHSHIDDSLERFSYVRLLPPATITSYNASTGELFYKVDTRREIKIGSFIVEKDTQTDKSFQSGEFKGKLFFLLFCNVDMHLYVVQEVDKDKVKVEAKK